MTDRPRLLDLFCGAGGAEAMTDLRKLRADWQWWRDSPHAAESTVPECIKEADALIVALEKKLFFVNIAWDKSKARAEKAEWMLRRVAGFDWESTTYEEMYADLAARWEEEHRD